MREEKREIGRDREQVIDGMSETKKTAREKDLRKRGAASKTAKCEESHPLVKTISIEKHL